MNASRIIARAIILCHSSSSLQSSTSSPSSPSSPPIKCPSLCPNPIPKNADTYHHASQPKKCPRPNRYALFPLNKPATLFCLLPPNFPLISAAAYLCSGCRIPFSTLSRTHFALTYLMPFPRIVVFSFCIFPDARPPPHRSPRMTCVIVRRPREMELLPPCRANNCLRW